MHEDRTQDEVDEESSRSLSGQIADRDLVGVHDKLERLDHHIADKEGAEGFAPGAPRHPVDDPEPDERRSDIARQDLRFGGNSQAEASEHRGGENQQRQAEDDGGEAADHKGEARAHRRRVPECCERDTVDAPDGGVPLTSREATVFEEGGDSSVGIQQEEHS